jgi:outer membrane receptor protein involved in Fe transport
MRRTIALFGVLLASVVRAEEPATESVPKLSETIVVTATRSERALDELPISATVIGQSEMEAVPPTFIDELLRAIPGVQMNLSGGAATFTAGQRLSMRGLGGQRALVLLDGVPLHDAYDGTIQWQKVPFDSLRQIEVIRGGAASLFGNFALGGTVNLLTRPVNDSVVRLDLASASSSTVRGAVTIDHAISENLALRISHDRFDSDGYLRVPNPGPVDINGWNDSWTTAARADYQVTEATRGFVKANVSKVHLSQGTALAVDEIDIVDASAGVQHSLSASSLLSTRAFYRSQEEATASGSIIGARESEFLSQVSAIPSNAMGASLEWSTQRSGAIAFVSLGIDVQRLETREHRLSYNRNGSLRQEGFLTGSQQFAGLFAQASWRPSERLEVLTSARIDSYKSYEGSDLIVRGAQTIYPEASSTQFDPRVSFRYALAKGAALRGAAYRAFKAPTLRELYRSNQMGTSTALGNPFLEPETLVGAELGVDWSTDRVNTSVSLFRSDIEGLQSRAPVPGQPNTFQFLNLGTSRSQGVEAMADVRFSPSWAVNLAYTYSDAIVVEDPNPALEGNLIPEVVPHIGSIALRYNGRDDTAVTARYRVLSRSYGEASNLTPSPGHRVLDLAVSRPIRAWIDAYASIENAFDENYFYVLSPTMSRSGQPRTFTLGIRMNIPTPRGGA